MPAWSPVIADGDTSLVIGQVIGIVAVAVATSLPGLLLALRAWVEARALQLKIGDLDAIIASLDRKSTRLNSSHERRSRMPSSA